MSGKCWVQKELENSEKQNKLKRPTPALQKKRTNILVFILEDLFVSPSVNTYLYTCILEAS